MKKYILTIMLFILIIVLFSGPETCRAESEDFPCTFSYGYYGGDGYHVNRISAEIEGIVNESQVSLFLRAGFEFYNIDETEPYYLGSTKKEGIMGGFDLGLRYYPFGQGSMERLFIGSAFGFYGKDTEKEDPPEKDPPDHDSRDFTANIFRLDTEIGYRFNFGSQRFSITPAVHYGYYWKSNISNATYKGASLSFTVFF